MAQSCWASRIRCRALSFSRGQINKPNTVLRKNGAFLAVSKSINAKYELIGPFKVRSSLSRFNRWLKALIIKSCFSLPSPYHYRPKWVLKKTLRRKYFPYSSSKSTLPQCLQRLGTSFGVKQSLVGRQWMVQSQIRQRKLKGRERAGIEHSLMKLACCSCNAVLRQSVSHWINAL